MFYKLVKKSRNQKTGKMDLISSSQQTCPQTCPFLPLNTGGCYGHCIPHLKRSWDKWSNGESGAVDINTLTRKVIPTLKKDQVLRYGEVGDLPGDGTNINRNDLLALQNAFRQAGVHAFTYTHYHSLPGRAGARNIQLMEVINRDTRANGAGLTINLSCESLAVAEVAAANGIFATCVIPDDGKTDWSKNKRVKTESGYPALVCPAVYKDDVQCISCGGKNGPLCDRRGQKKPPIICFPAHGNGRKKVNEATS